MGRFGGSNIGQPGGGGDFKLFSSSVLIPTVLVLHFSRTGSGISPESLESFIPFNWLSSQGGPGQSTPNQPITSGEKLMVETARLANFPRSNTFCPPSLVINLVLRAH